MTKKLNRWTISKNGYATWVASLPTISTISDIERLLAFARGVVDVGKQEDIFNIAEVPPPAPFRASDGYDYADYMEATFRKTQVLYFFKISHLISEGLQIPTRVAYYNLEGDVEEKPINNLTALLRHLRPELFLQWAEISPISISGGTIILDEIRARDEINLFFSIHTDIWFPKVRGSFDDEDRVDSDDLDSMFDNSELALRHTPRLNRFLSRVRQLTYDMNGTWGILEPSEIYKSIITETGINLDI